MKPVSLTVSMLPACSLERYFLCSLSKAEDFPDGSDGKESICNAGDPDLRRDRQPIPVFLGFPGGSDGKESTCNVEDLGLTPGLGRSPGGGDGNPHQYSCLENPTDRGAWQATGQSWDMTEVTWNSQVHQCTSNLKDVDSSWKQVLDHKLHRHSSSAKQPTK